MKTVIKNISVLIATFVAVFGLSFGIAQAATQMNTDPQDYATVRVSNYTDCPGCTNWTSSVSADAGDTVAVNIYFHNSGSETANNVRIKVSPQSTGTGTSFTFSGSVTADNSSNTASGSASVNLTSSQSLSFIPGQVFFYIHGNQQALPATGNEADLFNGVGYNIGNLPANWTQGQGGLVVHFKVSNNNTNNVLPPAVTTGSASTGTNFATLNGTYSMNGGAGSTWYEWATSNAPFASGGPASGAYSVVGTTSQGQNASGSIPSYTVSGLQSGITYWYRAVASNSAGTKYGVSVPFSVSGTTTTYQCNDGFDNDFDGYVDYPNDPGCSSYTDNSEAPNNNITYQCNDGFDNDFDGYVDYPNDPGCSSYNDNSEAPNNNLTYQCNDGIDNDGDGYVDYPNDPGCFSLVDNSEAPFNGSTVVYQCNDNIDNDGDGFIDYPNDAGCSGTNDNTENSNVINQTFTVTTLPPSAVGLNSATLNGVYNGGTGNVVTYFEYGTTPSFGSTTGGVTNAATTGTAVEGITGLISNTRYYYRVVAQRSGQTFYGATLNFSTLSSGGGGGGGPIVITTGSGDGILNLFIDNNEDSLVLGELVTYEVRYENIDDDFEIDNGIVQVILPRELLFVDSSRGSYSDDNHTLTVEVTNLGPGEEDEFFVTTRVGRGADDGELLVATAIAAYENPTSENATEEAIAFDSDRYNSFRNGLGAGLFGLGVGINIIGWLAIILILLLIILVARRIYNDRRYDRMRNDYVPYKPGTRV